MRPRRPKRTSALREGLAFWSIVIVVSAVAALIAFRVGRDWLGKRLGSVDMSPQAPRIVAQTRTDSDEATRAEQEAKAPEKAAVNVEEREPSAAERRDVERGEAAGEPQDGAQLHGREGDESAGKAAATDDTEAGADDSGEGGRWIVTTGSYADKGNATRAVARLAARGYKPTTETFERDGREHTRVIVAVMRERRRAEELCDELVNAGQPARIMPAR